MANKNAKLESIILEALESLLNSIQNLEGALATGEPAPGKHDSLHQAVLASLDEQRKSQTILGQYLQQTLDSSASTVSKFTGAAGTSQLSQLSSIDFNTDNSQTYLQRHYEVSQDLPFDGASSSKISKLMTSCSSTQTALAGEAPTGTPDPGEGTSSAAQDQQVFTRHDLVSKASPRTKKKSAQQFKWILKEFMIVSKIGAQIEKSDMSVPDAFKGMRGTLAIAIGKSGMCFLIIGELHHQTVILETEGRDCLNLSTGQSDDLTQAGSFINDDGMRYYYARVNPPADKKIRFEGRGIDTIYINYRELISLCHR